MLRTEVCSAEMVLTVMLYSHLLTEDSVYKTHVWPRNVLRNIQKSIAVSLLDSALMHQAIIVWCHDSKESK